MRSRAGMYDRQLLARLPGSRSPYGMQDGSERRLLGRLLGPATMNREQGAMIDAWVLTRGRTSLASTASGLLLVRSSSDLRMRFA